jgi:hypothetical protein
VPKIKSEELDGITLNVYLYIAKKGKPVGPRDAVAGAHLSSPSVAYRHLQKLEDLGLVRKNEYGEYLVKEKASIGGYTWIGAHIYPKMLLYSLFFLSILIVEILVLAIHFSVETEKFKIFFLLLISITGLAMAVFIVEGLFQRKRTRLSVQIEPEH